MKFWNFLSTGVLVLALAHPAQAGVFVIPHYVEPGTLSFGLEPEFTFSSGDESMGGNAKIMYGLSDMVNAGAIVGTGSGDRRFRVGGQMSLDFFPDYDGQPGIGLGSTGVYYRVPFGGQFEWMAFPYLHKSFKTSETGEFEPYVAAPVGFLFSGGRYKTLSSISVGSMFQSGDNFRAVFEIGIAIENTTSYMSGGIAFFTN